MGRHRRFVRSTLCKLLRRIVFLKAQKTPVALRSPASSGDHFSEVSQSILKKKTHVLSLASWSSRVPIQALPAKHRMQAKLSQTGSLRHALLVLALFAQQNIELVTQLSSAHFQDLLKFLLEFKFVARNFLFLYLRLILDPVVHFRSANEPRRHHFVQCFFFNILYIKMLFVMGASFFCVSFSET